MMPFYIHLLLCLAFSVHQLASSIVPSPFITKRRHAPADIPYSPIRLASPSEKTNRLPYIPVYTDFIGKHVPQMFVDRQAALSIQYPACPHRIEPIDGSTWESGGYRAPSLPPRGCLYGVGMTTILQDEIQRDATAKPWFPASTALHSNGFELHVPLSDPASFYSGPLPHTPMASRDPVLDALSTSSSGELSTSKSGSYMNDSPPNAFGVKAIPSGWSSNIQIPDGPMAGSPSQWSSGQRISSSFPDTHSSSTLQDSYRHLAMSAYPHKKAKHMVKTLPNHLPIPTPSLHGEADFMIDQEIGDILSAADFQIGPMNSPRTSPQSLFQSSSPTQFASSSRSTESAVRLSDSHNAPINERFHHWQVQYLIGKGDFGVVVAAIHVETGKSAALKLFHKRMPQSPSLGVKAGTREAIDAIENEFRTEAMYLREASGTPVNPNPYAIQFYETIEDDPNWWIIVMELANGGSIQSLTYGSTSASAWERVQFLMTDLILAAKRVHELGLSHGDIKPDNILLHDGRIKLGDFGRATFIDQRSTPLTRRRVGLRDICPPEQHTAYFGPIDRRYTDVFSVGLVFYRVIFGPLPSPMDRTYAKVFAAQMFANSIYVENNHPQLHALAVDLAQRMLWPYPEYRITIEEAARHPFVTGKMSLEKYRSLVGHPSVPHGRWSPGWMDDEAILPHLASLNVRQRNTHTSPIQLPRAAPQGRYF